MFVNRVRQHTIFLTQLLAHFNLAITHTGGALPMLNPMVASFTPQSQSATVAGSTSPASDIPIMQARPSTPPSLERFAKELKELKSSELSKRQRHAVMHDQKRQLLSHRTTAKAEIDDLQGRLHHEESIEGSQDILTRLKELNGLHEWTGYKWIGLGEEMADLEAEIAIAGEGEFRGL